LAEVISAECQQIGSTAVFPQRFFHRRVRQAKPLLHKMDLQHRSQGIRATPPTSYQIARDDQLLEPLSRNHSRHLIQKHRATRLFASQR
jgi:hypothetical protein